MDSNSQEKSEIPSFFKKKKILIFHFCSALRDFRFNPPNSTPSDHKKGFVKQMA